jgi:type IV pilus assembly protein PilQ
MRNAIKWIQTLAVACGLFAGGSVWAQGTSEGATPLPANSIDNLQVSQQSGTVIVKLTLKQALANPPASFSVANPARIALDFPSTGNGLGRNFQAFNEGDLRSVNVVQVGVRTRVVLNLNKLTAFDTRLEGNAVFVSLAAEGSAGGKPGSPIVSHFAESRPTEALHSIRNINFRRGKEGEARVVVVLSDNNTGIDIRQQGPNLVVEFLKTTAPAGLRRKLDVTDFATPVTSVTTLTQGDNVRMVISPTGLWEHNAYQSDDQFVIEVKRIIEDPNKLVQGTRGRYQGEKLSLNFQNIDVRAVLQVIADFTNFNIITSDTVGGTLTLRLKDVPWDQALDIILQARGLDMRKTGNVIWIAPRDEIATREKIQLESRQQIGDLEPVRTESFQLNYHKAKSVFDFLKNKDQTVLSKRGSVIVDERTNKLFVSDVPSRLEDVRKLITEIDIPVRQVLIEARIVEAQDTFSRSLGARLGFHDRSGGRNIFGPDNPGGGKFSLGANLNDTTFHTGQIATPTPTLNDFTNVNLPAAALAAAPNTAPGVASLILFNAGATAFLNLELSALEADGRGKVISSPRVVTANQVEALIEQGTEIPYQQATSSGATSVSFRKANLSLKVKPQITPDGRVQMDLDVNKDTPNATLGTGGNGLAIDTKHIRTDVLVENGGTVVIGGIYTQTSTTNHTRIPFFGDLPYVGFLFRNTQSTDDKNELLIFVTPKIVTDALTLR